MKRKKHTRKKRRANPYAVCRKATRRNPRRFESCVRQVKRRTLSAGKKNVIREIWDGIPPIGKAAIGIGGAFLAYKAGKKIYDNIQTKKKLQIYQQSEVPVTIVSGGTGVTQNLNLSAIASKIYDSFYNNDWFGWTEDETTAITQIQKVPQAYIPQLVQIYNKLYNKDLQADFIKYLSSDQWNEVSYLFDSGVHECHPTHRFRDTRVTVLHEGRFLTMYQ